MASDAGGPILVLAGIVIVALQVRIARRGTFSTGLFGGLTRENGPLGFWLVVGVNLLLGLAALIFGVRNLIAGH
jgi:hypothetical protein